MCESKFECVSVCVGDRYVCKCVCECEKVLVSLVCVHMGTWEQVPALHPELR